MRKLYALLQVFLVLFVTSCLEKHEPDTLPAKDPKPVLKGARKVTFMVDDAYDLSKTEVHSILDSVSMSGGNEGLYFPEGFESAAFFFDDASGEILAVVRVDTIGEKVLVNAASVTEALMTLVPAYHALSSEQRVKFHKEVQTFEPYEGFATVVDALLKNKQPIYSTSDTYIKHLIEINQHILRNYLGDPNLEGGRATSGGDDDFTNWLTRESGATLENQVFSYVYAEFTPMTGGGTVPMVIDPRSYLGSSTTALSTRLKDDCYTVNLNQNHHSAKSENFVALATEATGMFMNIIFNQVRGSTKNDCVGTIVGSIATDVSTALMGSKMEGASLQDVLTSTGALVLNVVKTRSIGDACVGYTFSGSVIAEIVAAQLNVFSKYVMVGEMAVSVVNMVPYVIALDLMPAVDPVKLTEIMQLHDSKLKEACVRVDKDGELEEEYSPGETISPGLKLVPQSQYAEWEKAGFEVDWVLEPGHGSVNLPESVTTKEGKSSVRWTLPDDITGTVTLRAEITDKEGDHLKGSPLKFNVTISDSIEFYRRAVIGNWTFEFNYLTYDDGVTQIDKSVFYEDGTGKRVSKVAKCYPRYGCTEDTFTDHRDKWGTDTYYDLVWSVTYDNLKKRYVFNHHDKRWGQNIAVYLNPRMEGLSSNSFSRSNYEIAAIKDK